MAAFFSTGPRDQALKRNAKGFAEIKALMRSEDAGQFVLALDSIHQFVSKQAAFYSEALPHYIEILEVSLTTKKEACTGSDDEPAHRPSDCRGSC